MRASVKAIEHFESATARVGGVTLNYWLGGDPNGPPVLLWHGFLGTCYSWHKVMPLLAEAGYAVLVPDMRGFEDSDKPAGNEGYDGRALAEAPLSDGHALDEIEFESVGGLEGINIILLQL